MPNDPTNSHELLFATANRTLLAPYGLDADGFGFNGGFAHAMAPMNDWESDTAPNTPPWYRGSS